MKKLFFAWGLLVVVGLWVLSIRAAFDRGYQRGGLDERACWTMAPAPLETWMNGEITARRDLRIHPLAPRARIIVPRDENVNSLPVMFKAED